MHASPQFYIVDFYEAEQNTAESMEIDQAEFDDDCCRFLATILESGDEVFDGGVHGGEQEIQCNKDFETLLGGRPKRNEAESDSVGGRSRDSIRDEITRQQLDRPQTNWCRINNVCMMSSLNSSIQNNPNHCHCHY